MVNKDLLNRLDYCMAVCRDNISFNIPNRGDCPCTITIKTDQNLFRGDVCSYIDRETAIALSKILGK